ncbi:TPA: DNA glycosylase, partial [Haemophilus influenzae]
MSENLLEIETHPFDSVLPPKAAVMMMGTFPPKEDKRAMQFHYPNFQNDMWRVYG